MTNRDKEGGNDLVVTDKDKEGCNLVMTEGGTYKDKEGQDKEGCTRSRRVVIT